MTKAKELAYDIVGSLGRNGYLDNSITCKDATDRIANSIQQYADQQTKEKDKEIEYKNKRIIETVEVGKKLTYEITQLKQQVEDLEKELKNKDFFNGVFKETIVSLEEEIELLKAINK